MSEGIEFHSHTDLGKNENLKESLLVFGIPYFNIWLLLMKF